tara:strand:+ start:385 stop:1233 length:849 start_codon:yes stop_codon:yes gene_type:complete
MPRTLQFKRYNTAQLANTTGANGEIIINTTTRGITVHDGVTPGGYAPTVAVVSYRANSIIFANTTGYLSNTSSLQFFTSNNTLVSSNVVATNVLQTNRKVEFTGRSVGIGYNSGSDSDTYSVGIGDGAGVNPGVYAVAIGLNSGNTQGSSAVAIGAYSGATSQGTQSVAIGINAGAVIQGQNSVAIGPNSGYNTQGTQSVAIGSNAGNLRQGNNAIAIGYDAGRTDQANGSIIINATGNTLDQTVANTFTVKPVRNAGSGGLPVGFFQVAYNPTTGEFVYYS